MDEKIQNWVKRKFDDIQEVSRDVSWSVKDLYETVCQSVTRLEMPKVLTERGVSAKPVPPDPQDARRELTEQMDRAIHRAYYKDGGFRFFGCELRRYAAAMDREDDFQTVWAGVYNTNIRPMLRQLEKLEQELEALLSQSACEPLPLENAELLERMRTLSQKAGTDRLDQDTDWQMEEYRLAVRAYVTELSERLLDLYQPPLEE